MKSLHCHDECLPRLTHNNNNNHYNNSSSNNNIYNNHNPSDEC